ncbi:MAG: YnbE family lipoprotein [Colwellia sp.]|jgi:hypothetical protein|nr:YnbE family lipoprotein [Colwellia sp.]MBL4823543.1 YnbE family lipoprotein [Colwellia sp.]
MNIIFTAVLAIFIISGCTHRIEVSAKEPITINLNLKIDHEIKVKVDKELDDIFSEESDLF